MYEMCTMLLFSNKIGLVWSKILSTFLNINEDGVTLEEVNMYFTKFIKDCFEEQKKSVNKTLNHATIQTSLPLWSSIFSNSISDLKRWAFTVFVEDHPLFQFQHCKETKYLMLDDILVQHLLYKIWCFSFHYFYVWQPASLGLRRLSPESVVA